MFEYEKLAEGADSVHGTRTGLLKGDSEVVERRRDDAGKIHPESIHTKAEDHCKEQRRGRTVCSSIGSVRSEGGSEHDALGFVVKPVLAIDAKAIEHILHRQVIGKLKHIGVAYLYVQDEISSQRLRMCRVRSEENVSAADSRDPRQQKELQDPQQQQRAWENCSRSST